MPGFSLSTGPSNAVKWCDSGHDLGDDMAVKTEQIALSTTATELTGEDTFRVGEEEAIPTATSGRHGSTITVRAVVDMFVGGSDVTTTNGVLIKADEVVSIDLYRGEQLFGILSTGTSFAYVLRNGV